MFKNAFRNLSYLVNRFVLRREYLVTESIYGVKFKFKTPDAVGRKIYKVGDYETEISDFVLNKIIFNPEDVFIDVGSNIGWYSLILNQMKNGPGVIYAFEPDTLNFGLLQHNINLNAAKKVIPINKALSDKEGEATLYKYNDHNLGRHSLLPQSHMDVTKVATTTLDSFFENHNKVIKLLKIDVEGFEWPVLLGAKKILNDVENLVIELSPNLMVQNNMDPTSVIQLLYDYGFVPYFFSGNEITSVTKEHLLQMNSIQTMLWKKKRGEGYA